MWNVAFGPFAILGKHPVDGYMPIFDVVFDELLKAKNEELQMAMTLNYTLFIYDAQQTMWTFFVNCQNDWVMSLITTF